MIEILEWAVGTGKPGEESNVTSIERHEGEHSDLALTRQLRRLTVETDRLAEVLRERLRMHRTDFNALAVIMDSANVGKPLSPGELAESLHLSPSATTALLDRLESAGHVHRERSPSDRRRIELHLREGMLESGRDFFAPLGERYAQAWARFDQQERAVIARFLAASIDATVHCRHALPTPAGGQADTQV